MAKTYRLRMRRLLDAPREKVFAAWTRPEAMKRFLRPHETWTNPSLRADARVGGSYRVAMRDPDGKVFTVGGVYREVVRPERLVFTWTWEKGHAAAGKETVVTIVLRARGKKTEMIFTHDLLPSAAEKTGHRGGWTGCFRILRSRVEGGGSVLRR